MGPATAASHMPPVNTSLASESAKSDPSAWLQSLPAINADLELRVVVAPGEGYRFAATRSAELQILEFIPGAEPRLTALLSLRADQRTAKLHHVLDAEVLMRSGFMSDADGHYAAGTYIRYPKLASRPACFHLGCEKVEQAVCSEAYLAIGHIAVTDSEVRRIDTSNNERWLPGPVDGTEVMPLHGHGTGNIMLIRWLEPAEFRPNIDPLGEEIFVLHGELHDNTGRYAPGTWIRNPVAAWQRWAGSPGTVVYYKNGHLPPSIQQPVV